MYNKYRKKAKSSHITNDQQLDVTLWILLGNKNNPVHDIASSIC